MIRMPFPNWKKPHPVNGLQTVEGMDDYNVEISMNGKEVDILKDITERMCKEKIAEYDTMTE